MITTTHLRKQLAGQQRMLELFQRKVKEGRIQADHPQIPLYEAEIEALQEYIADRETE